MFVLYASRAATRGLYNFAAQPAAAAAGAAKKFASGSGATASGRLIANGRRFCALCRRARCFWQASAGELATLEANAKAFPLSLFWLCALLHQIDCGGRLNRFGRCKARGRASRRQIEQTIARRADINFHFRFGQRAARYAAAQFHAHVFLLSSWPCSSCATRAKLARHSASSLHRPENSLTYRRSRLAARRRFA